MVSVDTVYQKVLAMANKEQRGYITPQEFNLFADQAQMEILEQYFYDIKQFNRVPGNNTDFTDSTTLIQEKLSALEEITTNAPVSSTGYAVLTSGNNNVYKLGTVTGSLSNSSEYHHLEFEEVQYEEYKLMEKTSITRPHVNRTIYYKYKDGIQIQPPGMDFIDYNFIKRPNKPNWNFVIVNDKPLYNASTSINFELHKAEEPELVYKIIQLAGINLKQQELAAAGGYLNENKQTQEKQ